MEECCEILDDIPIFAITSPEGQGVVLKSPDQGTSVFYFYLSGAAANATMVQIKKGNPELELKLTAYSLGQVYFKILKSGGADGSEGGPAAATVTTLGEGNVTASVDYRLVPEARDLMGAKMLLTMDPEDSAAVKKEGGMTEEIAKNAIARAANSTKFQKEYDSVPLFMIQQMRIRTPERDGEASKTMLPVYLSLADMVQTWKRFSEADPTAEKTEPQIQLMELDELVANMRKGGGVDFRSIMLVPGEGRGGAVGIEGGESGGGGGPTPGAGGGAGGGGQTLGDL